MVTGIRPERGGFVRPFGCGLFIRQFLLGHGPEGSPRIDPEKGACQADIKFHYKEALYRAIARDKAERDISRLVEAGVEVTPEKAEEIERRHFGRIPAKITRMRYHSFLVYFSMLRRLGWVEETGETEASAFQDNYPPGPPRKFYRLTRAGREAPDWQWSNPLITLYGDTFPPEYFRKKRKGKRYG